MIQKEDLPGDISIDRPAHQLLFQFCDDGITHPVGKVFQIIYFQPKPYPIRTTIGFMTFEMFDRISQICYIPDIKLPF